MEAQHQCQRDTIFPKGVKTELACYLARETVLVNKVVNTGQARYSDKERLKAERSNVEG